MTDSKGNAWAKMNFEEAFGFAGDQSRYPRDVWSSFPTDSGSGGMRVRGSYDENDVRLVLYT